MPRLCPWVLLALLASTQLGGSCSEPDAVPLEELQKDIPPPFDYALYCDENGSSERAWLPFLRARHALQNQEAPLDYSCSQFFRVAQQFAGPQPQQQ
jgi:hypothetical protein